MAPIQLGCSDDLWHVASFFFFWLFVLSCSSPWFLVSLENEQELCSSCYPVLKKGLLICKGTVMCSVSPHSLLELFINKSGTLSERVKMTQIRIWPVMHYQLYNLGCYCSTSMFFFLNPDRHLKTYSELKATWLLDLIYFSDSVEELIRNAQPNIKLTE